MKTIFTILIFTIVSIPIQATIHRVGSAQTYANPNALYQANVVQDGDTILIDAETYRAEASLAIWQPDSLLIKGVGGQAHLIADGKYISGKGIWVLKGNDIRVEHIRFEGAAVPDKNGAGIRLDGAGLIVRHCAFINNENGILTSNPAIGHIIIEYCEFDQGGHGDGFSHNLYVGRVNSLTYRFNYSHHARIGHLLKSRARHNYILYNRIMDEQSGFSSRLIDLPNGGFSIIMGNVMMQGPNAENSTLIGYGLEGLPSAAVNELYVINNSFLNKRANSGIFVDLEEGTEYALIANNIIAGDGIIHRGAPADIHHNLVFKHFDSVGFVDEATYDYRLSPGSAAIDYGSMLQAVQGHSLTPEFEYVHPTMKEDRLLHSTIDAGAYEYEGSSTAVRGQQQAVQIQPNPAKEKIYIKVDLAKPTQYMLYSLQGVLIKNGKLYESINVSELVPGPYFLLLVDGNGAEWLGRFLKM